MGETKKIGWPTTPWYIERGGFGGDGSYYIKCGYRLDRTSATAERDRTVVTIAAEEHKFSDDRDRQSMTMTTEPVRDAEAIANLLVSAPKLYDGLADMLRIIDAVRLSAGLGKKQLERVEAAKAALSLAEGRRP